VIYGRFKRAAAAAAEEAVVAAAAAATCMRGGGGKQKIVERVVQVICSSKTHCERAPSFSKKHYRNAVAKSQTRD
jgi:hypothetical protein